MKIIEQYIMGKRPDQSLCEDGIFVSDDFIAVIDGVTSKGRQKWQGTLSSGGFAKNIIIDALANMPCDIEKDAFFKTLDRALELNYKLWVQNDDVTEYLRACIAVYSRHYNEIWSLGDCGCSINGVYHDNSKKIDELMSQLRAFVIQREKKHGLIDDTLYTHDVGRDAVLPFIRWQLEFENDGQSDFGYGVLNGHGVATSFVKTLKVNKGDTVILASDGYPVLCDTLQKSEDELRRLIESDPLCYRENRGTKGIGDGNCSFDDRAYIRFEV